MSQPSQPANKLGMLDLRNVHRTLTGQELDAAHTCVSASHHSKLTPLPNHCISVDGELEGFVFECCADDLASVLPLTKTSFATTAVYECRPNNGAVFLELTGNLQQTKQRLLEVVQSLADDAHEPLKFDCMPDWDGEAVAQHLDQRTWRENIPSKIGVYHAFMRTTAQNIREHKIFIVVAGHCRHASEELYNLWLDARHNITAKQFMQCAEVDWLRKATLRHHNRLAARVARHLQLDVQYIQDVDAVASVNALLPTTSCVFRDMVLVRNRIVLSSDAVLLDVCKSGIVFDCFASEGFWVFMGPRDTGSFKMFGMEFPVKEKNTGFPSKAVRHHSLFPAREKANVIVPQSRRHTTAADAGDAGDAAYDLWQPSATQNIVFHNAQSQFVSFLFPHADFVQALAQLGFSINNGITNLMPIVTYCEDE